jgi:hypothetical protein
MYFSEIKGSESGPKGKLFRIRYLPNKIPDPTVLIPQPTRLPYAVYLFNSDKAFTFLVLRIRIRDPLLFCPLDLGSGSGTRIRDLGWEKIWIRIRDEHPESYFRELKQQFFGVKQLKFFYADPGCGISFRL